MSGDAAISSGGISSGRGESSSSQSLSATQVRHALDAGYLSDLESPGKVVGILAGNGRFPLDVAARARALGHRVVVAAHKGETDSTIAEHCDALQWIRVGQLGKVISFFRSQKAEYVTLAGGISRVRVFGGARPDWRAFRLLARLGTTRDDVLLRGVASELEHEGFKVFGAGVLLERAVPGPGQLTIRGLTERERADALLGVSVAHQIGAFDIGQSVAVFQGLVVAVEAVEGTDAMIRRAGELTSAARKGGLLRALHIARGECEGPVLVKCCKPQQDLRIDLPTVGPKTIAEMEAAGVRALVIEAGRTLLLDPDAVVNSANAARIAIVAVTSEHDLRKEETSG